MNQYGPEAKIASLGSYRLTPNESLRAKLALSFISTWHTILCLCTLDRCQLSRLAGKTKMQRRRRLKEVVQCRGS